MEREAFRQRMQQYKQARENNPQLKYWDWKKYADGGIVDEDPPQNTSERPITNFDPKGDPYNPIYGYNPGAGYVSNSDPLGSLYVEGALLNPVFKLAGNAVSNVARGLTKYSSKYVPEVKRTVQDKINRNLTEIDYPTTRHELGHYVDFNLAKSSNPDYSNSMFAELKRDLSKQKNPLFPDKTDYYSKGTEQKSYMNTLREYMFKNGMINNIGDKVTSRQIKKAIRSLPKDMRSIEAAYLQFATPGQYTKWFNKIPLLGTYPIVNKQFQNYEEDKDKAREQR